MARLKRHKHNQFKGRRPRVPTRTARSENGFTVHARRALLLHWGERDAALAAGVPAVLAMWPAPMRSFAARTILRNDAHTKGRRP